MSNVFFLPIKKNPINTFPVVNVKPEDALHGPVDIYPDWGADITFKSRLENIFTTNRLYRSTLDDPSSFNATQSLLLKPSKKR